MTNEQKQVIDFMQFFGQLPKDAPNKPFIPEFKVRQLRAKLMFEECLETIRALGVDVMIPSVVLNVTGINNQRFSFEQSNIQPNLVEIADGIGDLHYVGYCGTGAACGINMEPVFAEIHRSNMTKRWKVSELNEGIKKYPGCIVNDYGNGLARLLWNGKVIKSPSYEPADIHGVLQKQMQILK